MATRKKKSTKKASAGKESAASTPGRRGRKVDPEMLQTRLAVLERVEKGEIDNQQAAKELGLNYGTWQVWKSNHKKRTGGGGSRRKAKTAARKTATRSASPASARQVAGDLQALEQVLSQLKGIATFGKGLKSRLRDLLDYVEGQFPG